jgi:D-alanyl-D-alanine carboxypeptidase (penicillin-binding protein 5/6)
VVPSSPTRGSSSIRSRVRRHRRPSPPDGWLVADLDTGAVLAARNAHGKFLPASTIKTLTALALLPKLSPKTVVKPSKTAADMDGTRVGIKAGHPVTIEFLFTATLIYSGNDTATALAEAAGGEEVTVKLMNQQARRLQARDTLAVNPTGLDAPGQFSSPYDLALIGRAALKNADYRRYTAIMKAMVPAPNGAFEIANKNALLYTYEGAFGGKTGGTKKALNTYIGFAERGGRRLVVTIMKSPVGKWRTDAPALLDWGFSVDGIVKPVGQLVPPLDEVAASPSASASAAAVPAGSSAPAAGASSPAQPSVNSAPEPGAAATGRPAASVAPIQPKTERRGLVDRLPDVRLRWWYAVVVVALGALIAVALAWRARRRRRRGFYMPQTKLRLPVR